ncbi:MAG TPA: patatin-like phospholipase family protein [Saprospiraceae bacterium]|nr:patatin-like phospholipase family protein [Saprospiraceae bacterium]
MEIYTKSSKILEKYDVVILSGGGSKAFCHLGGLHFHYEDTSLDLTYVQEFRGTSAGSIISLLLVCGYTPMEIMIKMYNLKNFLGNKTNTNIWDVIKKKGLIPIDQLLCHLDDMVMEKLGYLPTLKELYDLTGKLLIMPTINITKKRKEYLSWKNHPTLSATYAARMSSNLPILFQEIVYNGNYYLDGGLSDNFPCGNINSSKKVLGILVTGTDADGDDVSFINYVYRAMMFPINTLTLLRAQFCSDNFTIISMVVDDAPVMELQMSGDRKMELFMKGYESAKCESNKLYLIVEGWEALKDEDDIWDIWRGVKEWD